MKTINTFLLAAILASVNVGCTTSNDQIIGPVEKNKNVEPVGKPSAPISMSYKVLTASPQPGQEIEIELKFSSKINSAIVVEANSSANKLTLLNANKSWQSALNKSGDRQALPVLKVIGPEAGLFYFRLVANVVEDGKTMAKAFVIPVKVGDSETEVESNGKIVTDEKGQRVIIQKAEKSEN